MVDLKNSDDIHRISRSVSPDKSILIGDVVKFKDTLKPTEESQ